MYKIKVMEEKKILNLIQASNTYFHPTIEASKLSLEDKLSFQFLLEEEFNNDFSLMIEDMMKFAVEIEDYELAAMIRDELNEKRKNV
jgi:hypothetical protein